LAVMVQVGVEHFVLRVLVPPLYLKAIKTNAYVKFSTLVFVTKNKDQLLFNSHVHKINTRQTCNLYLPTANLAVYPKGVYYSRIKI